MTDDTATQAPQTIETAPTVASTDDGQATAATQTTEPAPATMAASPTTQSIIASAVEQPTAATDTVAPTTQDGTPGTADALLQGISDLLMLAKILDGNPELFAFLKSLISGAKQTETTSTQA